MQDGRVCNRQEIEELSGNQLGSAGVSLFGQDNDDELYVTFLFSGDIFRIVAAP